MNETNFQISEKCVVPEEWKAGIGHDFRHYKGKMYRLLGLAPRTDGGVVFTIKFGEEA